MEEVQGIGSDYTTDIHRNNQTFFDVSLGILPEFYINIIRKLNGQVSANKNIYPRRI